MKDGVFIGLDVSMRATGLVMLDCDCAVVDRRVIGWPASKHPARTLAERIAYFVKVSKEIRAAVEVVAELVPVRIVLEGYAVHGPGDPTLAPELGGIVRLGLHAFDAIEVAPQLLKKYATGAGNAPKDAVMLQVYKRWGFDCGNDNNLADAYTLARMGRDAADPVGTTQMQRDVLVRAKLLKE